MPYLLKLKQFLLRFFKWFNFYKYIFLLLCVSIWSEIVKPIGATLWINYRSLVDDVIEVEIVSVGVPAFIQDKKAWEDFCSAAPFNQGNMTLTKKQIAGMHYLNINPSYFTALTLNQCCKEFENYKETKESFGRNTRTLSATK